MNKVNNAPPRVLLVTAVLLGINSTTVSAQAVYKSINARGETVYSSVPLSSAAQVEEVELAPGPTPEEVRQAREAGERITRSAEDMQAERLSRERAATQRRQEAEAAAAKEKQARAAAEQIKRNETMVEYYGYRDWTFPTPKAPEGEPETVQP